MKSYIVLYIIQLKINVLYDVDLLFVIHEILLSSMLY